MSAVQTKLGSYLLEGGLQVVQLDSGLLREQRAAEGCGEGQADATQQHLSANSKWKHMDKE